MDCTICDYLLDKINKIDSQVAQEEAYKNHYLARYEYLCATEVHKETKKMIRERFEEHFHKWMISKEKQIKIHKQLTKHYREDHLND